MDVKIIKSSQDTYWYAKQIGEVFEVVGVQDDVYCVRKWTGIGEYDVAPILKEDCKETSGRSKYGVLRGSLTKNWERMNKLSERAGYKTGKEIEFYEKQNKEATLKVYKIDEKE